MNTTLEARIEAEFWQHWLEMEQVRRVFDFYDPTAYRTAVTPEVTVYIKSGKIRLDFLNGKLRLDALNIAAMRSSAYPTSPGRLYALMATWLSRYPGYAIPGRW
jgi:hypothetical protein